MDALEFIRVRELEVAIRIWNPNAPRTLVAWHGLARHGGDFNAFARALGDEWRVIAPDTPGRGLSSWSLFPSHDYLYSHYVNVAIAVLDHFKLEQTDWLGTSMGGLLGIQLAAHAEHSKRISRLILNDVGPELNNNGLIELASYFSTHHRFTTLSELYAELREHYASFGIQEEATWRELLLSSARRLPDGSWTHHFDPRINKQFIHDTPRDMWKDWAAIRCPVMVIRGEHSTLLDAATLPRMSKDQPELVTLTAPGCGHAPMLDRLEQVAPIRQFLQQPLPAHSISSRPPSTTANDALPIGRWLTRQWRRWFK